ncbi:hypothetical protein UPYG_G00054870 [Umbra pygmaea]|uniref:Uncharacterized protein n=1 Tax=Umbra pygmaea TaxID=75934 RepID=A0ABD0XN54_UMBPY
MTSCYLFLLVYLTTTCCYWGVSDAERNDKCLTQQTCAQNESTPSDLLQCMGLPAAASGREQLRTLRDMVDAALDLYSFMRSSLSREPLFDLELGISVNPEAEAFQQEYLLKVWMEVKIKPLLSSISRGFLVCLSNKNFSCSAYQTMVQELSDHYSGMDPVRQRWIFNSFMYPFLSGTGAGCVIPGDSSEDWLLRNFGSFRAEARLKELTALNVFFSGLEVLDLLTAEQKAELLLNPGVEGLENGTLTMLFNTLMSDLNPPVEKYTLTTPGAPNHTNRSSYTPAYLTRPMSDNNYPPQPPPPKESLREVVNGLMGVFRPFGSFVREFVSLTHERPLAEISSTTLTQVVLNWTLAELAERYQPQQDPEDWMDPLLDVEVWYDHVVVPILHRVLPPEQTYIPHSLEAVFHKVFFLNSDLDDMGNDTMVADVCSITLDERSCGLTNGVEKVARVLHCVARSNLTINEETFMGLVVALMGRINGLLEEISSVMAQHFQEVFGQADSPALTHENLNDPEFIRLWFQIKLKPLLPSIPHSLLSCLSTKNFTCPVYQALVKELSLNINLMSLEDELMIYNYFLFPFLLNHNSSDPQCISSASSSANWLIKNFDGFSVLAPLEDFYSLNHNFSALSALGVLSPKQIAELVVFSFPHLPGKDVVINTVFEYLTSSPTQRRFPEFLLQLTILSEEVSIPCPSYKIIFENLYQALLSVPPEMEPDIWATINSLIQTSPGDCLPNKCTVTQFNDTVLCKGINSDEVQTYLETSNSAELSCNFTLGQYACASLTNFTAEDLVSLLKCELASNVSQSIKTWKLLLTKVTPVLDNALDILYNMSIPLIGPAVSEVLDVIGEIRINTLTYDQLRDSEVIRVWFNQRLDAFLPSVSGGFLNCLITRNLSCDTYQQILQYFSNHFDQMNLSRQDLVVKYFIVPFLRQNSSDPGCVSNTNSSVVWLQKNFGPFSVLVSITELLNLNPAFDPLSALGGLSPKQTAELVLVPPAGFSDPDLIINTVFDYLTASPIERGFHEFLLELVSLSEQNNVSCASSTVIFARLDQATPTATTEIVLAITDSKTALLQSVPSACNVYMGTCNITPVNETAICAGVNRTALQGFLNNDQIRTFLCAYSIDVYACSSVSVLTPGNLSSLLRCKLSGNSSQSAPIWKLFFTKVSGVLDSALDLFSNTTLDPNTSAVSQTLDAIREVRLDSFRPNNLNDPNFLSLWFNTRLSPFLPAVSPDFLSCLSTKNFSCSSYQTIIQILSSRQSAMTLARQISVYTDFIQLFLYRNNTSDPGCTSGILNTGQWLAKNFGGFSVFASLADLRRLFPDFTAIDILSQLSTNQLAEFASTPGQLLSAANVTLLMSYVPDRVFYSFFTDFSTAITGHESLYPVDVLSAMLQQLFVRGNLSSPALSDQQVFTWLRPLLVYLAPPQVAPLFSVVEMRSCSSGRQIVSFLDASHSTLQNATQTNIYNQILRSLQGSSSLRCYNNSQSFYIFLQSSFLDFGFPNLSNILSLISPNQTKQLVNTLSVSDLGGFLRRPNIVNNNTELCQLYSIYAQTPLFLQTESVVDSLRLPTLTCVWPTVLSSSQSSEVNAWFDIRLKNYLPLLTKSLVTSPAVQTAPCLAYQKLISFLGGYNYSATDFGPADVYNQDIRTYLISASAPKCYNAGDPELNSTAWFALNIGSFISYLTLNDLNNFGSSSVLQVFTVDQLNLALLNMAHWPQNLTNYYTSLVYQQDSNFNPLFLPPEFWCVVPGPAFSQLNVQQSIMVLHNLSMLCPNLDPVVAAALAGTSGNNINTNIITALGNQSTGLSEGQITMAPASVLWASINILSTVSDWNQGQANAIIQSLTTGGYLQPQVINASILTMLGSLVIGIPSQTFRSINAVELVTAAQNPTFVKYIITVSSTSDSIIQNVPDSLAPAIPRSLLQNFLTSSLVLGNINQKTWIQDQAVFVFNSVAGGFDNSNNLSSSVLQGFTSTNVVSLSRPKIKNLVMACRRGGNNRVVLKEEQLTSMYNYIKTEPDVTNYNIYPSGMLLYYDYSQVTTGTCRQYFSNMGDADFAVFSPALSYKLTDLVNNARTCLSVTSPVLNNRTLQVLGNMVCVLDGSYIQNSDPVILQNLQNCKDLTVGQVAAIETLLINGNTQHGAPANWTIQTLNDLGILPLYLTSKFYSYFSTTVKKQFLNSFLKVLQAEGTSRHKVNLMKMAIRQSIINNSKMKRSTVSNCTVGQITQVTIADVSFPISYLTVSQFNTCLTAQTVNDNLAAITAKVDDPEYMSVVLALLREAYSNQSTIPEQKVQVLGVASRVATNVDIAMWNITTIDTLSALMDPTYGAWDPNLVQIIIIKYLNNTGTSLGSAELNAIGGINLCSLDISFLNNITQNSLSLAAALNVSSCTLEKKQLLFTIAQGAFMNRADTISPTAYQLIQPYIGGATYTFIRSLSMSNINMDLLTFIQLNLPVVLNLTVTQVQGLLGTNLPLLKSYENQPVVSSWIKSQYQSDLDSLGLGLTGGKASVTAPGVGTITTAGVVGPAGASGSTGTTAGSKTTASGAIQTNRPMFGLHLFLTTVSIAALLLLQ